MKAAGLLTARQFRLLGAIVALAMMVGATPTALAKHGRAHVTLPVELEGELGGAEYRILVPEDWNGVLLIYSHGYGRKYDAGTGKLWAAPGGNGTEQLLLSNSYGLAASGFSAEGMAVKEGIHDNVRLANHFRAHVGKPTRTILYGNSMGGLISLAGIEKHPGHYDGAIPGCALSAGLPENIDELLAVSIAYDVTFGWPQGWGSVGDVRDDLNFNADVFGVLLSQLGDPRWEFIRLLIKADPTEYYSSSLFGSMFFATEGRAELETRAHGPVAQNVNHTYELSEADRAYLAGLTPPVDADALLAAMNQQRYAPVPAPRNYVKHYADTTGRIRRPVLTFHTVADGLLLPQNNTVYREKVLAAGNEDLLVQVYIDRKGHCNFTPTQLLTVITAMDQWLATGQAPDASAPDVFPPGLGEFVPGHDPGPWPFF